MYFLRIIRGIALTALTWSLGGVLLALFRIGLIHLLGGLFPSYVFYPYLLTNALLGALTGGLFAVVLALAGGRRTPETVSMPLIATCGVVAAGLMPLLVRMVVGVNLPFPVTVWAPTVVTNALLGGAGAAVMFAMARRAPALGCGDELARSRFPGVHTAQP